MLSKSKWTKKLLITSNEQLLLLACQFFIVLFRDSQHSHSVCQYY